MKRRMRFCMFLLSLVPCLLIQPNFAQSPPAIPTTGLIDLSPGADTYQPRLLALNHATHKLYVVGNASYPTRGPGLKVIDSTNDQVINGIDLGIYSGSSSGFSVQEIAIDESAAPLGNKVYLVGNSGTINDYLRVIDGTTDTNLTDENTDLFLPVNNRVGDEAPASLVVNSTNHKLYLAKANGDIVVIDGPNRQVLTTLRPDAGTFLIANPAANKIFVVGNDGGGVIDSTTDTFSPLTFTFIAADGVLDPVANKIYFVGYDQTYRPGVFVVDANTGQLLNAKTGFDSSYFLVSVTLAASDGTLYVGNAMSLYELATSDLSVRNTFATGVLDLQYDPANSSKLLFLHNPSSQGGDILQNGVGVFDRASGGLTGVATGYFPGGLAANTLTHRIYVSDAQTPELLALNADDHTVVARIPIAPKAGISMPALAVSERLNRIYLPQGVTTSGVDLSFVISVFDGATNQLIESVALPDDLSFFSLGKIAVDDTRRRFYVAALRQATSFDYQVVLFIYDEDTNAVPNSIGLTDDVTALNDIAVNPVTGRIYVSSTGFGSSSTAVVDGNTVTLLENIPMSGQLAINRKTNTIYFYSSTNPNNSNYITAVDGATDQTITSFCAFPVSSVAVDEVTNIVYAATMTDPNGGYSPPSPIYAFDANNSYQVVGQITAGSNPVGLAFNTGTRELYVANDYDGTVRYVQSSVPNPPDLFGNISTRAQVGTGDNVLIGGFIITAPQGMTKHVLVRAIGPSLAQSGVAGFLANPTIELHDSTGHVTTNDNWKIDDQTGMPQEDAITATGLAPTNDLESAIVADLPAGLCTAIVRGNNGGTGIGLVEAYDLQQDDTQHFANISTRGPVGADDNVLIGGVIVSGSEPSRVVLRAIGPSLSQAGVANVLPDPVLELHDANGGLILSNDDWKQGDEQGITDSMLAPTDDHESAILATLFPANYTAIVRGKDGQTGVALVEAYNLP